MRILVTAGPTREYIDAVRFLSNGSSGRMGCAVAEEALRRGHRVTLLCGPIGGGLPFGAVGGASSSRRGSCAGKGDRHLFLNSEKGASPLCRSSRLRRADNLRVVPFVSVDDLLAAMRKHFPRADAVVMAAAVGDFRPAKVLARKLRRSDGPITLHLEPTPDVLAAVASQRREGQIVFAFAVEKGPRRQIVAKALAEMDRKHADFVLLNTPAAMGAAASAACILSREGVVLPWRTRPKEQLARAIVRVIEKVAGE